MPEEQDAQHTVSFPWLKLMESVEIDDVVFWSFPAMKDRFDASGSFERQLQRIFSSYVDVKGNPISELTVVSFQEAPFKDLSNEEAGRVAEMVRLLAFSVMAENDYYRQAGRYFNATAFQHYHQRFRLGSVWVAPDTRRREGETLHGGYKHGELKFTMPLQAATTLKAKPKRLPILFVPHLVDEAERVGRDGKREKRSWKVWWIDEFYWIRNKITHGGKIDTAGMTWTIVEHLTIAAIILAICVKLKLAQPGLYSLTHEDETRADFIDFFLAGGNLSEEKLLECQHQASSERTKQKMLEHLTTLMPDEPTR